MTGDAAPTLGERFARAGLDWIVAEWAAPRSVHGFVTTRNGGVSTGARRSLDLGPASADAPDIAENRRRVRAFLPAEPVWLEQVHGADVATIGRGAARAGVPRADAAVTREADVVLAVRVADCLPVLLADRDATVLAIAHAGWRGLAAGVLDNTIDAMDCAPERIVAWVGPGIGPRAFEVGADVYEAFVAHDARAAAAFAVTGPNNWHADLEALARMRLADRGVASIAGRGWCTHSDPARFYSFRRDGATGRMAAFAWRARTTA